MVFGLASVEEDRGLDKELEDVEIEETGLVGVLEFTVVDVALGLESEEDIGLDEEMGELEIVDKGLVGILEEVTVVDTESGAVCAGESDNGAWLVMLGLLV